MSKDSKRQAVEQMRAEQARRQRQRRWRVSLAAAAAVVAAAGLAVGITFAVSGGGTNATASTPAPSAGALGSEGVPVPNAHPLAGLATAVTGQPSDGISCQTSEQTLFHIHAHLTIFVNGSPRQVPAAIGIPGAQVEQTSAGPFVGSGSCFYWLHTHAPDGIIHCRPDQHHLAERPVGRFSGAGARCR